MMLRSIVVATALVFTAVQAQAALITYDFESAATTSGGALVVLAEAEGGVTMTLTREGGVPFDIADISGFGAPASYGARSLDPFIAEDSATAFIADFSTLISSFTIDAGDFTPSDIDNLLIEAYSGPNATGALLSVFLSPPCCVIGGGFQGLTGGVAGANIASVRFIGGSNIFPNSMYYDNITINTIEQAVPEPASLLLLGSGLVGGVRRWRKRRSDV
jgi:hypothetical protein